MRIQFAVTLATLVAGATLFPSLGRTQGVLSIKSPAEIEVEQSIRKALNAPITIQANETPLATALDSFAKQIGVRVLIDMKALEESGVASETPVTCDLSTFRAEPPLATILQPLDLAWVINRDAIWITTKDEAAALVELRVYLVRDLVQVGDDLGDADFDDLIDTITSTVAPQSWDEVGGPGSIVSFVTGGALVCSQTQDVHAQIAALLKQLRQSRDMQGTNPIHSHPTRASSSDYEQAARSNELLTGRADRPTTPAPAWQVPRVYR